MPENTSNVIALVDLDLIVYQLGSVGDNRYYEYLNDRYSTKKELMGVLGKHEDIKSFKVKRDPLDWEVVKKLVIKTVECLLYPYVDYKCYLSGSTNFRYSVATIRPYKGNRSKVERPYHYDNIRQLLVDTYDAILSVDMEADDLLGLNQVGLDTEILTLDKDLNVVPGRHYDWTKNIHSIIDELDADKYFFKQVLTGDPTDNILGLYGIGKNSVLCKKVEASETVDQMFEIVSDAYESRFGSYWDMFMLENSELLWIKQSRSNPIAKRLGDQLD